MNGRNSNTGRGPELAIAGASIDGIAATLRHNNHPDCSGFCGNNITLPNDSKIAATGLALLPLLGSGSAPGSGPYAEEVCMEITDAGLDTLMEMESLWNVAADHSKISRKGMLKLHKFLAPRARARSAAREPK